MAVDGKGKTGFMRGAGTLDHVAKGASQTDGDLWRRHPDRWPLVQVGQRMIDSAAKMMIGKFFAAADAELKAERRHGRPPGFFANFWRYLYGWFRSLFARAWNHAAIAAPFCPRPRHTWERVW